MTESEKDVRRERERQRIRDHGPELNRRRRERAKDPLVKARRRNYARKSYYKNRERRIADSNRWQKENSDRVAIRHGKRKDRLSGFLVTPRDLKRKLMKQNGLCFYCTVKMTPQGKKNPTDLQWDHVMPLSRGGRHSIGNLVGACRDCNLSKGTKTVREWMKRK